MHREYRDPEERLQEAIELFQLGRTEAAHLGLLRLLELGYQCAELHLYLGHCELTEERIGPALLHYKEARRRDRDLAEVYVGLGVVAARRLNFPRATRLLIRALKLQPGLQEALDNLILTHAAEGDLEASDRAFRGSVGIDPEAPHPYFNAGFVHFEGGDYAKALDLWVKVIQLAPEYPDADRMIATCERILGRQDEARRRLERVVKSDPRDVSAWADLGLVHEERDEWQSAVDAYRRALEIDPAHARVRSRMGSLLCMNARAEEGMHHLLRAGSDDPDDPDVAAVVASALRSAGDVPTALQVLRRAVRAAPFEPEPRAARARFLEACGHPARAAAAARAHRLDPDDATVLYGLARSLASAGATRRAIEVLEGGLARFSDQATPYGLLGEIALRRGDPKQAADYLEQGLQRLPKEPALTVRLAESYLRLGRIPRAIALARRSREEQGFAVQSLDVLGRAYLQLGEYERVVHLAEALLQAEPGHPRGVYLRGRARLLGGDAAAAADDLRCYVRAAPGDPEGYHDLARCLDELGEDAAARAQQRIGEYLERSTTTS